MANTIERVLVLLQQSCKVKQREAADREKNQHNCEERLLQRSGMAGKRDYQQEIRKEG